MNTTPSTYTPLTSEDFIGDARRIAQILEAKCQQLKQHGGRYKALLYGNPGVGKTELIKMAAVALTGLPLDRFGNSFATESISGQNVSSDTVRRWTEEAHYRPMHATHRVKLINEIDRTSAASQVLLLDYLDALGPDTAVFGTSNLQLDMLSERFQTRLQQFKVRAPSTEEIATFLARKWGFKKRKATEIAVGSGGNVRCALLDAQSVLDAAMIPV